MVRRLFLGLFIAICLVALGGLLFISNFDLNRQKERIQEVVLDRTGRVLTIDGEINTQFFPRFGLTLNDITLANATGFEPAKFATARSAELRLAILPLVSGNFKVRQVILDGVDLNLHINEDGVANWEDLLATTTVVETDTNDEDVLQSVEAGAPLAAALSVGAITMTDSRIRWKDEKSRHDVEVAQLNLTADAFQLGRPFAFTTSFDASSESERASSRVAASGTLAIDLPGNSYTLQNLAVTTTSKSARLPVDVLDAALTGNLRVNLKSQTFDLTGFRAVVERVPFTGEIHGTTIFEVPGFYGEIASEEFALTSVINKTELSLADDIDTSFLNNARFEFSFQKTDEQIFVKQLQLAAGDAHISGDFEVSNLTRSPVLSGSVASNTFNPAPWMSLLGWKAADPLVMQQASLSTAVRQSGQILSFNDLVLVMDDFELSGDIEVTDIHAASPPLVFELQGSIIDIERYLPASHINETEAGTDGSEVAVSVAELQSLDINGRIILDELSLAGVTFTELSIPVVARDGLFEVTEARASLYDGTMFNSASLDLTVEAPVLTWSSNISAVQSDVLLRDYFKTESPVSGTGVINVDVVSRGLNPAQWLATADGAVSMRFTDGVIRGINLASEVRRAHAQRDGETLNTDENRDMAFTELSATGEINEGLLRSDDLLLNAPPLRVTGVGSVRLNSGEVDYMARVLFTEDTQDQGRAETETLKGLTLPIPVTGTLEDLVVDFKSVVVNALQAGLREEIQPDNATREIAVPPETSPLNKPVDESRESGTVFFEEKKETAPALIEQSSGEPATPATEGVEVIIEKSTSNFQDQ